MVPHSLKRSGGYRGLLALSLPGKLHATYGMQSSRVIGGIEGRRSLVAGDRRAAISRHHCRRTVPPHTDATTGPKAGAHTERKERRRK